MSSLRPGEFLITDVNYKEHVDVVVDGELKSKGLIPRDYLQYPLGCYGSAIGYQAVDMPLIPKSEWPERIRDMEASKSRLSDIRLAGNNGQSIPSLDQDGVGYCFPSGTLIRMADGSQKAIDTIRIGDEVLTARNSIHKVKQLHGRQYQGDLVTVQAWGHSHLRCTPNHKILTKRGYVPAGDLTSEDSICIPRYVPQTTKYVQTAQHVSGTLHWVRLSTGVSGWELGHKPCRNPAPMPDMLELTPGAGRIFGLWLAEGSMCRDEVIWSFGAHETQGLAEELVGLLREEWGIEAEIQPNYPHPTVTTVTVRGGGWNQLFHALCGCGAGKKKLHADLASGPKKFLKALLQGWLEGDGNVKQVKRRWYQIGATISKDLATDMFNIANALGLRPAILKEKPQVNKYAKTRQPVWKVKYPVGYREGSPCGYDYRVEQDEAVVWRRVRSITREAYNGSVHNIGVEEEHSYVAEGIAVSNCWAHSSTHAVTALRAMQGLPYVPLSAFSVAATIKKGADQGGWGAHSLDFISTRGVVSQALWPQGDRDYKKYDRPEIWANAALHKVSEGWIDMQAALYDRQLSFEQEVTCYLCRVPVVKDENWWGHSICGLDVVNGTSERDTTRVESGKLAALQEFELIWGFNTEADGFGVRIWNSWSDTYGDRGMAVLTGRKAVSDGATAPRVTLPSVV